MELVKSNLLNDVLVISLFDHVDSNNASDVEFAINKYISENTSFTALVIDCEELKYISSAGLRIVLKLKKQFQNLKLINASTEIYEIFDMTGFTEMMTVEKAYRKISVEGCDVLGKGSNGIVYRISDDMVVKLYFNPDCLPDIQRERTLARKAFVLGIPTAISFDIVKSGDSYGSVFELVDAKSMSNVIAEKPESIPQLAQVYVDILRKIHDTVVEDGSLPSMKEIALGWARDLEGRIPTNYFDKLIRLIENVPESNHMLHGDYHTNNVMMQKEEPLLIDMDTLCIGDPVFEFGSIYMAYYGFYDLRGDDELGMLGLNPKTCREFAQNAFELYFNSNDKAFVDSQIDKARVICYTRLLRRTIRRHDSIQDADAFIESYKASLLKAIDNVETLQFDYIPKVFEITVEAKLENLEKVTNFVNDCLETFNCNLKAQNQIDIVIDELFSNIAYYANVDGDVEATVRVKVIEDPLSVEITFIDGGKAYDPLSGEEPDITLGVEERKVGGLGIFIVKNIMDEINYEYKDGHNILTVKKNL